jgi:hypothetical protein
MSPLMSFSSPPVTLASLVLGCARPRLPCARMCPAGGRVGDGVPVVILSDFPVGKILRVVAVVVCSYLPLLQRFEGSALLGST